jgi:integrase/recombinase XerD
MELSQAMKEYLIEIEIRKYSPRTIKTYRLNVGMFARYCKDEIETTEIEDVTVGNVKQFTQYMSNKGRKGTYINSMLKAIKSFIQYCYDEGYGGFNTNNKRWKWVKEDKTVIRTFKTNDVKHILDNCNNNDYLSVRDRAILTVFFECGIRCLELCMIKEEDIHEDFIIINGKNHKQRVVPITPILRKALLKYDICRKNYFALKKVDDYYFLSRTGRMLTVSSMEHMMHRRGEGITDVRVSPHTCRHFFAQMQVKMGTDLYTISRLLGHNNVGITQIYLNSLRDDEIIKIAKHNSVLLNMK